ncbi:hypothetical protein RHMOL_Rhmol03G0180400 [Rhododendron molle]|uniref:Uncharacterized protein n=1 Tax=Rhododendron molle TaxID=49168 RepID=A0ACC0PHC4_RHOML|nr:hypothetical protein RHMOL_Rhmol03G0180400 [Rhododendron molle]
MRLAYALSFLSLSILATIAVLYLHRRSPFSPISVAVRHSLLPFLYTEPKHEKTLPSSLAPHSAICSTATVPRYLCRGTVALAPLSLSLSTIRSVHSDPSGLHRRLCRLRPRQEQPLCGRRRRASSKIEVATNFNNGRCRACGVHVHENFPFGILQLCLVARINYTNVCLSTI